MVRSVIRSPALQIAVLYGMAGVGFPAANLLLARLLAKHEYAVIALIVSLVNLSYPLGPLGLEKIVVRRALHFTRRDVARGLWTSAAVAVIAAAIGRAFYGLELSSLILIWVAVVGGSMAFLAAAKFQSLERFPLSVALAQISSYFLLLAAIVSTGLGVQGPALPLGILALGHVLGAAWGWRKLCREGQVRVVPAAAFGWTEALSLAGVNAALLVMMQLERLVIPKALSLEDLALFGVVASIVIAPLRMLQLGVGTSPDFLTTAQAPQCPSRHENGASSPLSSSTSSSFARRGQETSCVVPSSVTIAVAGPSSLSSASIVTAAKGSDSSDLNTSMWIRSAGSPDASSASSAAAMNGPGPQMNASRVL